MSAAGGILLRIFTGPHAGAEIELGSDSCLLGSDEACDIILHDSSVAPRHARLEVRPAPLRMGAAPGAPLSAPSSVPLSMPAVWITALEGPVQIAAQDASEEDGRAAFPAPAAEEPAAARNTTTAQNTRAAQNTTTDGAAADSSANNAAAQPLPSGVPCYIGFTCIAWAVPDQAAQTWTQVMHALEPLLNPGSQHHRDDADDGEAQDNLQATDDGTDEAERDALDPAEAERKPPAATLLSALANNVGIVFPPSGFVRRSLLRHMPLLLVAVLLAGLCVGVGQRLENTPPSAEELRARLAAEGFGALEVTLDADGLRVRGTLRGDAERGRLVRVVQSLQFPVRLDVYMDGDAAHALAAAFNSRGLFPEVRNDEKDAHVLRVTGYMKDSTVEDWAFAGAREDLPALPKGENALQRRILHAEDVDSVLRPALARAGLNTMVVRYLPGTVEIAGILDVARRTALENALQETRKELALPLIVTVRENAPDLHATQGAQGAPGTPAAVSQGADPAAPVPTRPAPLLPAFSVTSVTMQPLRFITLGNGERVFEGGLLAGGYTLEEITTRQLTLRRNGQTTMYPLRGNHDTK